MAGRDLGSEVALNALEGSTQLIMSFIDMLTRNMDDRNKTMYQNDVARKNNKAIFNDFQNHQAKGGHLEFDSLNRLDAPVFRDLLKANNVTFSEAEMFDKEKNEKRRIFITKDCDKSIVNKIRSQFQKELTLGLGEIDIKNFAQQQENHTVNTITNMSREDLEVFRYNANMQRASFAVEKDKHTNTFNIHYDNTNRTAVNNALRLTAYDLSGDSGLALRKDISKTLQDREEFVKAMYPKKGHVNYIVDSKNPNEFIAVTDKGFSYHKLKLTETGVTDDPQSMYAQDGYKDMIKYIEALSHPFVVTSREMQLVRGIDEDHRLSIPQNIDEYNQKLRNMYALNVTNQHPTYEPINMQHDLHERTKNNIPLYQNLKPRTMKQVEDYISVNGSRGIAIKDNSVAFDKTVIGDKLDHMIQNSELSDDNGQMLSPLPLFAAQSRIKNRGFMEVDKPTTSYIFDPNYNSIMMSINKEEFKITRLDIAEGSPGRETVFPNSMPNYESTVWGILSKIQNPVIMSQEELQLPDRERLDLFQSRLPEFQSEDLTSQIAHSSDVERLQMLSQVMNPEEITPKQREALESMTQKWHDIETKVDKSFVEKVRELDFNDKKVVKEKVPNQQNHQDYGYELR